MRAQAVAPVRREIFEILKKPIAIFLCASGGVSGLALTACVLPFRGNA